MEFEWDAAKSAKTLAERGFDFAYASTVFLDADRLETFSRRQDGEDRLAVIGQATGGILLFVVYSHRTSDEKNVCRIISARQASKKERVRYPRIR
jgi:uncharacterized protein